MKRWLSSVSLPTDLGELADKFIDNFSEYVRDCIKRDFTKEYLQKLNEQDFKKIKNRKKIIRELKKGNSINIKSIKISKEEKEFLIGARKRIKDSPGEISENCRVYNMKFSKKLNLEKFRELVG